MPTYTFYNQKTDDLEEHIMRIKDLDIFKNENPHLEQRIVYAPPLADPVRIGREKPDGEWRDYLRRVKQANPGSNVETFD